MEPEDDFGHTPGRAAYSEESAGLSTDLWGSRCHKDRIFTRRRCDVHRTTSSHWRFCTRPLGLAADHHCLGLAVSTPYVMRPCLSTSAWRSTGCLRLRDRVRSRPFQFYSTGRDKLLHFRMRNSSLESEEELLRLNAAALALNLFERFVF